MDICFSSISSIFNSKIIIFVIFLSLLLNSTFIHRISAEDLNNIISVQNDVFSAVFFVADITQKIANQCANTTSLKAFFDDNMASEDKNNQKQSQSSQNHNTDSIISSNNTAIKNFYGYKILNYYTEGSFFICTRLKFINYDCKFLMVVNICLLCIVVFFATGRKIDSIIFKINNIKTNNCFKKSNCLFFL